MELGLWLTSVAWESASHYTTLPSAPNKESSSPSIAGHFRCAKEYFEAAKDLDSKCYRTSGDENDLVK